MSQHLILRKAAGAATEGKPLASASDIGIVARERGGNSPTTHELCIAQYTPAKTFVNESRKASCDLGQETLSARKWPHTGGVV